MQDVGVDLRAACKEEFGMGRGVEEAVEIAGVVQHLDIVTVRRAPVDMRTQPALIAFQHLPVGLDPLEDHGRNREDEPGRVEAARGDQRGQILMPGADVIGQWAPAARSCSPMKLPSRRRSRYTKRASPMTMRCRRSSSARSIGCRPASPMIWPQRRMLSVPGWALAGYRFASDPAVPAPVQPVQLNR